MASLREILRSTAIQTLSAVRLFPTLQTDPAALRGLMQSLYPLLSGHELMRLGPKGDGGYLVPDDLEGIQACFSPGVSDRSGFEIDCAERGMDVFLADASVDGPAENHPRFTFTKKFLGGSPDARFMTLDQWVSQSLADSDAELLLQMDIEGFEYEVFALATPQLLQRCRIIVVEFHDINFLWSQPFFKLATSVFTKLLATHACVHAHPNNVRGNLRLRGLEVPRLLEFTFLRRDRMRGQGYATEFPHPLDSDNLDLAGIALPPCWYHSGENHAAK
ncbi:MAG: FkbM family methyltransferase [Opitutales bacterium]